MDTQNTAQLLKQERERTDKSLVTERGKSDDSLSSLRDQAKSATDKQVLSDRKSADEDRAQSRIIRDNKRDAVPESNVEVKIDIDLHVLEERRRNDGTVLSERNLMDAAIVKERALFEDAVQESLKVERQRTDKNLGIERDQSDNEVQRAGQLLIGEVTRHSLTKAALTTRDELLAIVSHDLRNPIGAIQSCADMLLEESKTAMDAKDLKIWIEFIKRNAESSLRLISDLLDMERVAQGNLQIDIKVNEFPKLLKECTQSFVHQAAAKSILLRSQPVGQLDSVSFDRDRILQVLSNLIGNALKFTPDGGSVTVKFQVVDKELQVSVIDTGPGIAIEQQARIFERFAQIQNKDRRGLGLGLYISRMIIEAHRGRLWVDSTIGQGSCFTFAIPH